MGQRSTLMQVPKDVSDKQELTRFLNKLMEYLDTTLGNRSDTSSDIIPSGTGSISGQLLESDRSSLADRIRRLEEKVTTLETYH